MNVSRSGEHILIGVKNGRCVSIADVESGKQCGCVCGACEQALVAKKGKKRIWHFAHAASSDCRKMGETHLHLAAKQILRDRKEILLPEYRGQEYGNEWEPDKEYLTASISNSPAHSDLRDQAKEPVFKSITVKVNDVRVEEWLDGIRPDVVFEKDGRPLLIEIKVTHATENSKCHDIRRRNLACIEIDLSAVPREIDLPELEKIVTGIGSDSNPAPRKWISCPKGEKEATVFGEQRKLEFSRRIRAARRKLSVRPAHCGIGSDVVELCPIHVYRGRPQVRIIECIYCEHHVAYFGVCDESLHAELTDERGCDVVYCACSKEMAEAHLEAERRKAISDKEEEPELNHVRRFADLGHDLPSEIAADSKRLKVWEIQKRLEMAGYSPGETNGRLNSLTRAALQGFQSAHGLTPHGEIDALTLATLPGFLPIGLN